MSPDPIVVVGLGGIGSAALASLARRGIDVVGIDRSDPPHRLGSSHGGSRVVRSAYFEHPGYVSMARTALEGWDRLETETRLPLFRRCGVLLVGSQDSTLLERSARAADEHRIPVRRLTSSRLRAAFPFMRFPDDFRGLLEPGGGFVVPETAIEAHLEVARRHGARILTRTRVLGIEARSGGAEIRLESESIRASKVVVAVGAWVRSLLGESLLQPPLRPQRKVMIWCRPRTPFVEACSAERMPAWLIDDDRRCGDGLYYGVPASDIQTGPGGVKIGFHGPGTDVDPDAFERSPDARVIEKMAGDVATYLPDVFESPHAAESCLYTMSTDEHFIVDEIPDRRSLIVATGFSGHGFKFAPVIGDLLAALALGERRPEDAEFLSLRRFGTSS